MKKKIFILLIASLLMFSTGCKHNNKVQNTEVSDKDIENKNSEDNSDKSLDKDKIFTDFKDDEILGVCDLSHNPNLQYIKDLYNAQDLYLSELESANSFLFIPKSNNTKIEVYSVKSDGSVLDAKKEDYELNKGSALFVKMNVPEGVPEYGFRIIIEDKSIDYIPVFSGKDGELVLPKGLVEVLYN